MLRSVKSLFGYTVKTTEGDIGVVHDFLFNHTTWNIQHGVVDTGGWLLGQKVLLSPSLFKQPEGKSQQLQVDLSKERVKNSRDINADLSVWSQRHPALGGMASELFSPFSIFREQGEELATLQESTNPHLCSIREMIGYQIQGSDIETGLVDDLIIDDELWKVAFLVVESKSWMFRSKLVVSSKWAKEIHLKSRTVAINLTQGSEVEMRKKMLHK